MEGTKVEGHPLVALDCNRLLLEASKSSGIGEGGGVAVGLRIQRV